MTKILKFIARFLFMFISIGCLVTSIKEWHYDPDTGYIVTGFVLLFFISLTIISISSIVSFIKHNGAYDEIDKQWNEIWKEIKKSSKGKSNNKNKQTANNQPHKYSIDYIDNQMTGHQFEEFVKDLLLYNGFEKAHVTKASGDYGVDVIGFKDGVKYAVQCKKYSGSVGIDAVQQVVAGKAMYKCDKAVVITNSGFTRSAKELARQTDTDLWGRGTLLNMMK